MQLIEAALPDLLGLHLGELVPGWTYAPKRPGQAR